MTGNMKFCIYCGQRIPLESSFCEYCGKKLSPNSSDEINFDLIDTTSEQAEADKKAKTETEKKAKADAEKKAEAEAEFQEKLESELKDEKDSKDLENLIDVNEQSKKKSSSKNDYPNSKKPIIQISIKKILLFASFGLICLSIVYFYKSAPDSPAAPLAPQAPKASDVSTKAQVQPALPTGVASRAQTPKAPTAPVDVNAKASADGKAKADADTKAKTKPDADAKAKADAADAKAIADAAAKAKYKSLKNDSINRVETDMAIRREKFDNRTIPNTLSYKDLQIFLKRHFQEYDFKTFYDYLFRIQKHDEPNDGEFYNSIGYLFINKIDILATPRGTALDYFYRASDLDSKSAYYNLAKMHKCGMYEAELDEYYSDWLFDNYKHGIASESILRKYNCLDGKWMINIGDGELLVTIIPEVDAKAKAKADAKAKAKADPKYSLSDTNSCNGIKLPLIAYGNVFHAQTRVDIIATFNQAHCEFTGYLKINLPLYGSGNFLGSIGTVNGNQNSIKFIVQADNWDKKISRNNFIEMIYQGTYDTHHPGLYEYVIKGRYDRPAAPNTNIIAQHGTWELFK